MKTRTETIQHITYCAYCGKELDNVQFKTWPAKELICDCKKAKEELDLYDKLKELYNHPLANNLIEMKVDLYRNKLMGKTPDPDMGITGAYTIDNTYFSKYCSTTGALPLSGSIGGLEL